MPPGIGYGTPMLYDLGAGYVPPGQKLNIPPLVNPTVPQQGMSAGGGGGMMGGLGSRFMNPLFLGGLGMLAQSLGGAPRGTSPFAGFMQGAMLGNQYQQMLQARKMAEQRMGLEERRVAMGERRQTLAESAEERKAEAAAAQAQARADIQAKLARGEPLTDADRIALGQVPAARETYTTETRIDPITGQPVEVNVSSSGRVSPVFGAPGVVQHMGDKVEQAGLTAEATARARGEVKKEQAAAAEEKATSDLSQMLTDYRKFGQEGTFASPGDQARERDFRWRIATALARKLEPEGKLTDADIENQLVNVPSVLGLNSFWAEKRLKDFAADRGITLGGDGDDIEDLVKKYGD